MIKQNAHMVAPVKQTHSEQAYALIAKIRNNESATQHIAELTELVIDLTDAGLKFYFIEPLERIEVSSMTMKVAKMGLSSTHKGMKMVITKVLKKLSNEQVLRLSDFLEEILSKGELQQAA